MSEQVRKGSRRFHVEGKGKGMVRWEILLMKKKRRWDYEVSALDATKIRILVANDQIDNHG
jgi:hypothetical protein